MMALGFGFRRGASIADFREASRMAVAAHDRPLAAISAIATEETKIGEPGITAFAGELKRPLMPIGRDVLALFDDRVLTRSAVSMAATGSASVSEASALAAAGRNARLLGPRVKTERVTCAIAEGDGP